MRRIWKTEQVFYRDYDRTGRERIMSRKAYVFVLAVCVLLCGCTRKEQLILDVKGAEKESSIQDPDVSLSISEEAGQLLTDQTQQEEDIPQVMSEGTEHSATKDIRTVSGQDAAGIWVHVCGAVVNPGVYELSADSRVYEAVQEAGGFTENADLSYVNQAQRLTDGAKLVIPTVEQVQAMSAEEADGTIGLVGSTGRELTGAGPDVNGTDSVQSDGRININTASEQELCSIPGIGATRAAAIVAYRQERGSFTSIEDIMNVSGIKEGTYAKIKDSIKVN